MKDDDLVFSAKGVGTGMGKQTVFLHSVWGLNNPFFSLLSARVWTEREGLDELVVFAFFLLHSAFVTKTFSNSPPLTSKSLSP